MSRLLALPMIALVRFYRLILAPIMPASCRFYPSCSSYSLDALGRYGAFKGARLSLTRILKCHPFHPGGYDPVK